MMGGRMFLFSRIRVLIRFLTLGIVRRGPTLIRRMQWVVSRVSLMRRRLWVRRRTLKCLLLNSAIVRNILGRRVGCRL